MTKATNKRLILLDSHAIIHRAYHALPDFASSKGEPTGALYGLATMLFNIIKTLKPDYIVATFDLPGPTYRHEAFKDYKAGRKKGDDNLISQLNRAKDLFDAFNIPMYSLPGFEADDMLGTIVHQMKDNNEIDIVIASGDMDTMQLIDNKRVQVYTLKKGIKDTIMYDEKAIKARFGFAPIYLPDYKGLRGDPSDNLPGVKGIGEKTGGTLIAEYHTIENLYRALKKDKEKVKTTTGITERIAELLINNEDEALFSKTLATIRLDAPIEFKVPEKLFKESLDMNKVRVFFDELEFKSLADRLLTAMGEESSETSRQAQGSAFAEKDIGYDPVLAEEAMVMRFLIDSNISSPETDEILRFTKTETLKDAHDVLTKEIEKRELVKVWEWIEKPLIPVLADMKKLGIKLDIAYNTELSLQYHGELKAIDAKIFEYAGREFNIDSPKQLGEVLFNEMGLKGKRQKKTAGGAPSTKESELLKLKDLHPIIEQVLEHRELQKLLSTYIDTLPTLADEQDRVHTSLIQYGAATGRMASTHPNLQNIPIKSEKGRAIRKVFIAEKGYDLVAIDYSQMELRIAAFLSGDKKLIQIFKDGQDVHTAVAAQVFKVDPKDVDKEMRRKAKVINFGILYGMGVTALKDNLGGTREEAQLFYNTYFETFTELAAYLENVKAETARKGYTETYFGRRRYIEGMNSSLGFIKSIAERAAINAPIQGTEADVIKWAMVKISDWVKSEKLEDDVRMLLQVHDELLFEIKEGKTSEYVPKIREIMENIIDPNEVHGVKMTTESSAGNNWGNLKKL